MAKSKASPTRPKPKSGTATKSGAKSGPSGGSVSASSAPRPASVSAGGAITGYLPNDMPPPGELVLLGLQHVLTMFPATVLVAIIVGFHTSTVLFATGLATVVALLLSRLGIGKFIPLYYGSSFSYLAATLAITLREPWVNGHAPDHLISLAQTGILATGLINVAVGLIIRFAGGKKTIDMFLPPVVTGSVAAVIGFALGAAALNWALDAHLSFTPFAGTTAPYGIDNLVGVTASGNLNALLVAVVTLLATIVFSVYLQGKGFMGMIPVLLGAIVGYVVAYLVGMVKFEGIAATFASPIALPHFTFPSFSDPLVPTAMIGIGIMAIATIPESTAHLYQISLYVDHLADEMKQPHYNLNENIGFNLVFDGIGDMINGLLGSTAGTNYGENNSLMVITRNYSGPALMAAGVIAMLMGFSTTLSAILASVPFAVAGGLSIYLFGVIGMQGIALMMSEKVDLYDPQQLAIGAAILIIGVGGHIGYPGGFLPIPLLTSIFPAGWPAIATGAVVGIVLNLIFMIFKRK
jgi:uracil permease